jgi:hypothetical protein
MLTDVTTLYGNCDSSQIILHTISNPELRQLSQKYYTLRKQAFELEITETVLPWTSFMRKLLFAWSYSPLPFDIQSICEIKEEYDRIAELWQLRKDNFQEAIKSSISEILDDILKLSTSQISLSRGYSKIAYLNFDKAFVCQKHWGWGIDNDRLSNLCGIRNISQSNTNGPPSEIACFFGSPQTYDFKGQSGIWTAPRFKEIHFIIFDHTGNQIPKWKNDSIDFNSDATNRSPWNCQVTSNILNAAPTPEIPLDNTEPEVYELGIKELIESLNRQHYSGSNEDEVFCVLLLSENENVIPIRQHSKPECLILGSKCTLEVKEAEDITSGDVILIRSSGGNTLKEIESRNPDKELTTALSLHRKWKEALLQRIDTGLITEIRESVDQTPQSIRNWSKPENHGPDKKETFVALMNYLDLNSDTDFKWKTIQGLRGIGHSYGTDASEQLKAEFAKLDSSETRRLSKEGTLTKYLNGDSEAAAMTAIRISDVLSYSAKIRPTLINHILTLDNIPWL